MKFAYADPPYLGLAAKFFRNKHPEAAKYDKPETHQQLINRLCAEYDGWAMSLHTPSLKTILPMCPGDCRVMAWVKPFVSFKPGITVAYAWEPVIIRGGRQRPRAKGTIRDWVAANMTLHREFPSAKPEKFCFWLFEVLNMEPGDDFDDLFPGSGAVSRAWKTYCRQKKFDFDRLDAANESQLLLNMDTRT